MAIGSDSLVKETEKIYTEVDKAFAGVQDFASRYQYFVDFHFDNTNIDMNIFRDKDVDVFRTAIQMHNKQEEDIEELEPITDHKLFRINAGQLKQSIRHSPSECLRQIQHLLPELSYEKLSELCQDLKDDEHKLQKVPTSVDEFVHFKMYLNKLEERMTDITDAFQVVEQLHIVMDEYRIKLPERNKLKFKDTHQTLKSMKTFKEENRISLNEN